MNPAILLSTVTAALERLEVVRALQRYKFELFVDKLPKQCYR
jgi:hypothetical protein